MWHLKEYREPGHCLADFLPWVALIAPGVILNKDGSFQASVAFRGPDLASSTKETLMITNLQVNNALKRLSGGWTYFIEARRRISHAYKKGQFPTLCGQTLDEERSEQFAQGNCYFESDYIMTFVYMPPEERMMKVQDFLIERQKASISNHYEQMIMQFQEQLRQVTDLLTHYLPYFRYLDSEETLTYLHSTISFKKHACKVPSIPLYLDVQLSDTELHGGLDPMLGDYYIRTVSIKSFPGSSWPGMMDALNQLPIEYRWMTRFIVLDKVVAEKTLNQYRRKWFAKRKSLMTMLREIIVKEESIQTDTDAMNKALDAGDALEDVTSDSVAFGYFTASITVWDKDLGGLKEKLHAIERIINGLGFVSHIESIGAVQAWLGSLPGHCYANPRKPLLHTYNLAHMMPLSAIWAGPEEHPLFNGPPLLQAVTSGNTPFRLVTHVGDVGHCLVIGPTGAGKSVLLGTLALQFTKYNHARVIMFDKGGSQRAITLAMQGNHYRLGEQSGLSFQPLADIDQEKERSWAQDWLIALCEYGNEALSAEQKRESWLALSNLAHAPEEQRTLYGLLQLLQDPYLRQCLEPYTIKGPFGFILDGDHTSRMSASVECYEMEDLMQYPSIVAPVLSYMFHRLEQKFDGKPTLLLLDEAWLFLDSPQFAAKIREWLKVLRKRNVSVIFATQSLADAMESSIAPAILESCLTRIFLPNKAALEAEVMKYYQRLSLNPQQIYLIATATPKQHYYVTCPDGQRLFELGLGSKALMLLTATSKDDHLLMNQILEDAGKHFFFTTFLQHKTKQFHA